MKMLYRIRVLVGDIIYENKAEAVCIGDDIHVEWVDYRDMSYGLNNRVTITLREEPSNIHIDEDGEIWIE